MRRTRCSHTHTHPLVDLVLLLQLALLEIAVAATDAHTHTHKHANTRTHSHVLAHVLFNVAAACVCVCVCERRQCFDTQCCLWLMKGELWNSCMPKCRITAPRLSKYLIGSIAKHSVTTGSAEWHVGLEQQYFFRVCLYRPLRPIVLPATVGEDNQIPAFDLDEKANRRSQ